MSHCVEMKMCKDFDPIDCFATDSTGCFVPIELPTSDGPSLVTGYIAPCPFCGGKSGWHEEAGVVACSKCNAYMGQLDKEEAIKSWNKRAI